MKARNYWQTQGRNFMTPEVLAYYEVGRFLVELSTGRGMDNEPIFGVSVATEDGTRDHERSGLYFSEEEARTFIDSLGGQT